MSRTPRSVPSVVQQTFDTAVRLHGEGQLQRAEYLYRDVLRQSPRHADALNMLGVVGCQTGSFAAGAGLIRQALEIEPRNADFHNNLGMALLQMGDHGAATAAFEAAVGARPNFAEGWFNLGNARMAVGDHDAAEKAYRRALRARAEYPDALNNLGNLLRERGQAREAAQLLARLARLLPDFAPGHLNLGMALQADGQVDAAVAAVERACELDPKFAPAWARLGELYRARGEPIAAETAFRQAVSLEPRNLAWLRALGLALFTQTRVEEARAVFETALTVADDAACHDLVGTCWAAQGDRARAEACFEHALALDPALGSAWRNLGEIPRDEAAARTFAERIETVLPRVPEASPARAQIEFALGKVHDELGEADAAFAAYERANTARRASSRFDAEAQARYIDALIEVFDAEWFDSLPSSREASEVPVLVVGMPRSGTTLVEQVLAAHSQVFGAGELTYFAELALSLPRQVQASRPFPFALRGQAAMLPGFAGNYLERLRARGGAVARVIDKMPYNFLYLGLAASMFSQARVVHCRRHPVATCFSIYARDLAGNHPYAYDLADLAAAYAGYVRLMAHWRSCLPLPVLDIDYESLVVETEPEARRLVAFLGLDWEPACLAFDRVERVVTTASQWQVRQPVYTTARDHWRAYTPHLGPLVDALANHGIPLPASGSEPG